MPIFDIGAGEQELFGHVARHDADARHDDEIRIRVADLLMKFTNRSNIFVRDVNTDILHGARGLAVHALEFLPVIVSDAERIESSGSAFELREELHELILAVVLVERVTA